MRKKKKCPSPLFQQPSGYDARVFWRRKHGNALRLMKRGLMPPNSFLFTSKLRMSPKPNLLLRYMTAADLPQVMEIDRLSFEIPWSEKSYRYEMTESNQSFMVVLEWNRQQAATRWQRWLNIRPYSERRILG